MADIPPPLSSSLSQQSVRVDGEQRSCSCELLVSLISAPPTPTHELRMLLLAPGWPWLALAVLWALMAPSCPSCLRGSVQDLAHRAGVVFEGRLYEELQGDMNERERERQRQMETLNRSAEVAVEPEETLEVLGKRVRVRVRQVWEVKAGGLQRDAVVSLVWSEADECFRPSAGTRYVFFMESTNDSAVFRALSPPVETRRGVRKDVSRVLGPSYGRILGYTLAGLCCSSSRVLKLAVSFAEHFQA